MKQLLFTIAAILLFSFTNAQDQQEESDYETIKIEDKKYSKRELGKLVSKVPLTVGQVAAYKVRFAGKKGYLVVYCYQKKGELETDWVHFPTKERFDEVKYKWEKDSFTFGLHNSETGDDNGRLIVDLSAD